MEKHRNQLPIREIILYTYFTNKEGRHPLKLRVTFKRKQKYYPINADGEKVFLTPTQFERILNTTLKSRKGTHDTSIRQAISYTDALASESIKTATLNNRPFTFERFENEFLMQESKEGFIESFNKHIQKLNAQGRIGTASSYSNAIQAFKKFRKSVDLNPIDLTCEVLENFDSFLREEIKDKKGNIIKQSKSINTVAIYMRSLRVAYYLCSDREPILLQFHPFETRRGQRGKYKIKTAASKKGEALSIDQLKTFKNIQTTPEQPEHEAKWIWWFSFRCSGMNFRDLINLKYSNIKEDRIEYIREKTKATQNHQKPIRVPLDDEIKGIIKTYGNPNRKTSEYVFDILTRTDDSSKMYGVIKQKLKITNKWLKRICAKNNLPEMTTYWARHSFSDLGKQSRQPIEIMREFLGHDELSITEGYQNPYYIRTLANAHERMMCLLE